jgi:hypothetical protein
MYDLLLWYSAKERVQMRSGIVEIDLGLETTVVS